MSMYIKQQYNYTYTTTVIEVKIPALSRDILEDDAKYAEIVSDVTEELRKFGALR
jgi:hypothetical protein